MLRREVLKAMAACMSLPVVKQEWELIVAPDWEVIVGGNRSGKTTIGAKKAKRAISHGGTVLFTGYDINHCGCIGRDFFGLPWNPKAECPAEWSWEGSYLHDEPVTARFPGITFATSKSLNGRNVHQLPNADMLWIDESVFDVEALDAMAKSGKYKKIVWTTWPSEDVLETVLYKHGRCRRIPMRPETLKMYKELGIELTPEERVFGKFTSKKMGYC